MELWRDSNDVREIAFPSRARNSADGSGETATECGIGWSFVFTEDRASAGVVRARGQVLWFCPHVSSLLARESGIIGKRSGDS